jgi:hypothetical protein
MNSIENSLLCRGENMKNEFEELQDRMEEKALIYKDTKFDPFYRFIIGEIDWSECTSRLTKGIETEIPSLVDEKSIMGGYGSNSIKR